MSVHEVAALICVVAAIVWFVVALFTPQKQIDERYNSASSSFFTTLHNDEHSGDDPWAGSC